MLPKEAFLKFLFVPILSTTDTNYLMNTLLNRRDIFGLIRLMMKTQLSFRIQLWVTPTFEAIHEMFRLLNKLWIGLFGLCWLVMVLLACFLYKRLIFIPKFLKILQLVNKRPQFCVIR